MKTLQYYIIYKPFQVLSQFSAQDNKRTLKDFFEVPVDVYPVGRLDFDSEGLLILTNDKSLNHQLLQPSFAHQREYWAQLDGAVTPTAIQQLQDGIAINVSGKSYTTQKCNAAIFKMAPPTPPRTPPIRYRKEIPAPWIKLTLTEGKNRQVRKMCAAVGFPVLRLIRSRIEGLTLQNMQPGEMYTLNKEEIYSSLSITQ